MKINFSKCVLFGIDGEQIPSTDNVSNPPYMIASVIFKYGKSMDLFDARNDIKDGKSVELDKKRPGNIKTGYRRRPYIFCRSKNAAQKIYRCCY